MYFLLRIQTKSTVSVPSHEWLFYCTYVKVLQTLLALSLCYNIFPSSSTFCRFLLLPNIHLLSSLWLGHLHFSFLSYHASLPSVGLDNNHRIIHSYYILQPFQMSPFYCSHNPWLLQKARIYVLICSYFPRAVLHFPFKDFS